MRISSMIGLAAAGLVTAGAVLVTLSAGHAIGAVSQHSALFLLNGGFEAESGWENHYNSATNQSGFSTSRAFQGKRSLWISDGLATEAEGWRSAAVSIVSTSAYRASVRINTDSGHAPYLYLKFYDTADIEIASYSVSGPAGLDVWQEVTVTGQAPAAAATARIVLYSSIDRSTVSYFDAVDFGPSATQSLVGNQDFELDAVGAPMPAHWYHYSQTSQPVSIAIDPDDAGNQVLQIVDASSTAGTNAGTRFTAAPGAAYQVSVDIRRASGTDAVHLYVRYYDAANVELSSWSASTNTAVDSWQTYTSTTYAPEPVASGEVVVACIGSRQCDSAIDNVKSVETFDRTLYAAAVASGTGDGSTPANAAGYRDSSFWSGVDTSLMTQTVKVVLQNGTYAVAANAHILRIESVGSSTRRLTIAGESPYGVVFSLDANITEPIILLKSVRNVTFTDFHVTSTGTFSSPSAFLIDAFLDGTTRDVDVRRFSIVDAPGLGYSGVGVSAEIIQRAVYDVSIQGGTFARNGTTAGYHHVYVERAATSTDISNNLLEDSAGTYVKLRGNLAGVDVTENLFYSTGTWYNNVQFVQWAVYNDVDPGDEWFGSNYRVIDNRFEFRGSWCDPNCKVFSLTHRGFNPIDDSSVEHDHLLDATKREELLDTSEANVADRTAVVESSFLVEIDNCTGVCISGSELIGVNIKFTLFTTHDYGAASQGGSGSYDISNLLSY